MSRYPSPGRLDLTGLPRPILGEHLERWGIGAVHTRNVFSALHRERLQPEAIEVLGPRKSALLARVGRRPEVTIEHQHLSDDGTEKLVFRLHDDRRVEGVLIPQERGRVTFCVSSQVGCAMGCGFCATATMGLVRHLDAGEIVEQVALARQRATERGETLRNLVFMGMGEPLHNYEATTRAIRVLSDHLGQMHAQRHITVSTVGLVPRIHRLAEDFGGRIQLAVSLSSATDTTRRELVPITRRHDLESLRAACLAYPLPGARRFILVEYVLLAGVTDTPSELDALAEWTRGMRCLVNLIPWNGFAEANFRSPAPQEVDAAVAHLQARQVPVTVRQPRGRDVAAACGQLARLKTPASAAGVA